VKIQALLRLVTAAACLGHFPLNAALTEEDCRKFLADKITAEGEGRIKLVTFKTTKLVQMLVNDEVPLRGCAYEAELEFLEDTKWNVHPGIEIREFKTWKMVSATTRGFDAAKFNEEINHPGLDFPRGSRAGIVGTISSWYRDNKWSAPEILAGIRPPKYEAPATGGPTPLERAEQSTKCLENLQNLGFVLLRYRTENTSMMPASFFQLTNEIGLGRILVCPADTNRADILKIDPREQWAPVMKRGSTYQLEWAEKDSNLREDGDVMIRCPVHGSFCNFAGKVIEKRPDGSLGPPR